MSANIRTLIIDAFAKIERQHQRVVRIKANHEFVNVIKECFKSEFDEISNPNLRRLVPTWLGSLFGAHVYIENDLDEIIFEGDHSSTVSVPFKIAKKEHITKQQDTKRKFRFILEEK